MKKTLSLLIFVLAISNYGHSQSENKFDNELQVDMFHFFVNTFQLGYEHFFPNSTSFVVKPSITLVDDSYEKILGLGGEVQFRIYPLLREQEDRFFSFNGLYFAPYAMYKYYDMSNYDEWIYASQSSVDIYEEYSAIGTGILIGVKMYIVDRISIDLNVGGGLRYSFLEKTNNNYYYSGIIDPDYTGILPRSNLSVGLRF